MTAVGKHVLLSLAVLVTKLERSKLASFRPSLQLASKRALISRKNIEQIIACETDDLRGARRSTFNELENAIFRRPRRLKRPPKPGH
jgi:hypothetical protein